MRRRLLFSACLLLPAAAFLIGCEGRRQTAQAEPALAQTARSDAALPTTITHDHQPPPRTPEN